MDNGGTLMADFLIGQLNAVHNRHNPHSISLPVNHYHSYSTYHVMPYIGIVGVGRSLQELFNNSPTL